MSQYAKGKGPICPMCNANEIRDRAAKKCGACNRAAPAEGDEAIRGTQETTTIQKTIGRRVRTLADLIRVCDIDTSAWEIVRWECKASQMGSIPRAVGQSKEWSRPSTKAVVTQLFHLSVSLRAKVAIVAAKAEIANLLADAKKAIAPRRVLPFRKPAADAILLEPGIYDLHAGKLAWGNETGWENYDSRIAERDHDAAVEALVARTASHPIGRILYVVGNDLLHSDNKAGTTTGGTPLDNDSRYHKMFSLVRRMETRTIDRLSEIAPVDVVLVPGNHDTLAVWHLGDSLECWYHGRKHVTIENTPRLRKYYQHGRVMLMLTHGNRGKLSEYPLLMATEQRAMWGATTFREAHTGDKHQTKVQEFKGVKVRTLPALCPPDAWHSEFQFVGNARAAEAFVWHKDEGLIAQAHYSIPAAAEQKEAA